MTNKITTVCNGCGKEKEGEDQFDVFYRHIHPSGGPAVEKTHYCPSCEPSDKDMDHHPNKSGEYHP